MNSARIFADRVWALIARVSGWRPGSQTRNLLEWLSAFTGAVVGVWAMAAIVRGDDAATKHDITILKQQLEETMRRLASQAPPGVGDGSAALAKELDKAIATLLTSRRADALKDKTGAAAEAALDELIEQRTAARAVLIRDLADLYRQKGAVAFLSDTQKALNAYAKATELDPDDPAGWNQLGRLQLRTGDIDAAASSFERVRTLGNLKHDQRAIAMATGNLGLIYAARGNLDEAEAMHRQALQIDEALGSKEGIAADYGNLGNLHQARSNLDEADRMYRKSLALYEELGLRDGMANAYGNLGLISYARGDFASAEDMQRKALTLDEALGYREGMAADYANLGLVHQVRGNFDDAEAMHGKALALHQALGAKGGMAAAHSNLGTIHLHKGDLANACTHWRQARELFAALGIKSRIELLDGWLRNTNCPAA